MPARLLRWQNARAGLILEPTTHRAEQVVCSNSWARLGQKHRGLEIRRLTLLTT